jgi:hypothetical protein
MESPGAAGEGSDRLGFSTLAESAVVTLSTRSPVTVAGRRAPPFASRFGARLVGEVLAPL